VASEAEYFEIGLAERCDPEAVRAALDASLPPGLDILEVVEAGPGSLPDRVNASVWQIALPGVALAEAQASVAAFLAAPEVSVTRLTKDGRRVLDARAAVVSLQVRPADAPPAASYAPLAGREESCVILDLVVRHTTPAVRPDDVLTGLRQVGPLVADRPSETTRLAQGTLDETGGVSDPLAPDRPISAVVPER
jgi:radical SAM-linked protein